MPNTERPILTERYIRQVFGNDTGMMTEVERRQTARERDVVDEAQFKTGRPIILVNK